MTESRSELSSRRTLLSRAAILTGGVAAAAGFPAAARATRSSREGVRWNAADGTFQSEFVVTSPASAADNLIQPTADVTALTLKGQSGQSAPLLELQDFHGDVGMRHVVPNDIAVDGYASRLDFPFTGGSHGPTGLGSWAQTLNGTIDPIVGFGYNIGAGGQPIQSGEPVAGWYIEGDYNNGSARLMEAYVQWQNSAGSVLARPFFADFNREAATRESAIGILAFTGHTHTFFAPVNAGDQLMMRLEKTNPGTILELTSPDAGPVDVALSPPSGQRSRLSLGYGGTTPMFRIESTTASTASFQIGSPLIEALLLHNVRGDPRLAVGFITPQHTLQVYGDIKAGGSDSGRQGRIILGDDASPLRNVGMFRGAPSGADSGGDALVLAGYGGIAFTTGAAAFGAQTLRMFLGTDGSLSLSESVNLALGTNTGTKIGTARTQKLGFFDAAPVSQRPSHGALTAGPGFGSKERNMLNDVYSGLRALGLLA